jgi:hypothetical protein
MTRVKIVSVIVLVALVGSAVCAPAPTSSHDAPGAGPDIPAARHDVAAARRHERH